MSSSNADEISAWLDKIIDGIDFTMPGRDKSLGRDLAGVVAQGIIDRSVPVAVDPGGTPWDDNEDPYKGWKARKYDARQPGILTGQMLSLESIIGDTAIASETVEMRYGTDTPAKSSRNGVDPPKAKEPPTDRQKAEWFTESGREFYALDEKIADKCVKEMSEGVGDYLRSK